VADTDTVESLSWLVRSGLFGVVGELVGVAADGKAVICGPNRTPVVRFQGPRPDGVRVAPRGLGCHK
jgi:hypothetical protein